MLQRWHLIIPLGKQWEMRHPYRCFHYALKHYGKDVGWKTFFFCSSEVVTPSAGLSQYSLALCCGCFGSQREESLPCVPFPVVSLVPPAPALIRVEKVRVGEGGVDGCRCPVRALTTQGLKQWSGCCALLGWSEVEEHMGGFLPPPLLFLQLC